MKMHILYNFREGPWGGGNQFLKALRLELRQMGLYAEQFQDADIVVLNGSPSDIGRSFKVLRKLKKTNPEKIILFRLDGPVSLIRGKDSGVDRIFSSFCKVFVDGLIYQSDWSMKRNRELFKMSAPFETTVYNAPDSNLFYPMSGERLGGKCRVIATSWSPNMRKGFDIYLYLDEHLDFDRYEMTFVGNSPVKFTNIKQVGPVDSSELGELLRSSDIYITASKTDPCSNSLIEALACGLPAVALRDGGHPELIQRGGELFDGTQDVIEKIDLVARDHGVYKTHLPKFDISVSTQSYVSLAKEIFSKTQKGSYKTKCARWWSIYCLGLRILLWQVKSRVEVLLNNVYRV